MADLHGCVERFLCKLPSHTCRMIDFTFGRLRGSLYCMKEVLDTRCNISLTTDKYYLELYALDP